MEDIYYTKKDMGIFLCYAKNGRVLAGKLKKELESYGFKVFIAHKDIRGSKEWEDTIMKNIESCDVFCILLTDDVPNSEFCDQETGIAISHKKIILPLKTGTLNPYGFAKKYQALKIDIDNIEFSVRGIIDSVCHQDELKDKSIRCLIEHFGISNTYEEAGTRASDLVKFVPFSKNHLNRIAELVIKNNQIYSYWEAQTHLKKLFSDNKQNIEDHVLETLKTNNLL